jgi:hypothetical protein
MKEETNTILSKVIGGLLLLGLSRGCNMAFNNRNITTPAAKISSRATGLIGHVEKVEYSDGMADVKVYPSFWGHRYASSRLYQDIDGDGLVDKIRINGPEWQMNRLKYVLDRVHDYEKWKDQFDYGDKLLQGKK